MNSPKTRQTTANGQNALVVLKDEGRNVYLDVAGLFAVVSPEKGIFRFRDCLWWDFGDLHSGPEVKTLVRVIRSVETRSVKRQLDHKRETLTSDWVSLVQYKVSLGEGLDSNAR